MCVPAAQAHWEWSGSGSLNLDSASVPSTPCTILNRGHANFRTWQPMASYFGLNYSPLVALYPASSPSFVAVAWVQGFYQLDRSLVRLILPSSSCSSFLISPHVLFDLCIRASTVPDIPLGPSATLTSCATIHRKVFDFGRHTLPFSRQQAVTYPSVVQSLLGPTISITNCTKFRTGQSKLHNLEATSHS